MKKRTSITAPSAGPTSEWWSPAEVVTAARTTLGKLDLDPASTALANRRVRAARIFTQESNGLEQPWSGRVFVNPPGGKRGDTQAWWRKLVTEWNASNVSAAIFLGFNIDLLQTGQNCGEGVAPPTQFPFCVPRQRLQFLSYENGRPKAQDRPPNPNVIVYFPATPDLEETVRFQMAFRSLGEVVVPIRPPIRSGEAQGDRHE